MGLKELLVDTAKVFDRLGIRYVLIGGYAGIIYGSPYTTGDIDFVVAEDDVKLDLINELRRIGWIPTEEYKDVEELRAFGQFYHKDAGYPLHIFPHVSGFEIKENIKIEEIEIDDYPIKICSPEDLVVMRLVVWDEEDKIKAIAVSLAKELDLDYLKKRAKEEKVEDKLEWLLEKVKEGSE